LENNGNILDNIENTNGEIMGIEWDLIEIKHENHGNITGSNGK